MLVDRYPTYKAEKKMRKPSSLVIILTTCLTLAILPACAAGESPSADAKSPTTPAQLSKIAGWKGADVNGEDTFRFVVISDRTGRNLPGKWAGAVEQVNLLRPDFVLCVGDLIQGYTEDEQAVLDEWKEFEAIVAKLDAPFFYTAGNHDTTNDMMRRVYRERHGVGGKSYYSFDYRGCHFVVLDSWSMFLVEESREEQLAWLEQDLAAAKDAKHVFVMFHNPAWEKDVWPRLRALLPPGKTTIFSGHTHRLGYNRTEDNIETFVLGSSGTDTGQNLNTGWYRTFAHVTVDKGRPTVTIVPVDQLLPGRYNMLPQFVRSLGKDLRSAAIPAEGGQCTYRQENSLSVPVEVQATWDTNDWHVTPAVDSFRIEPGQAATRQYTLLPKSASAKRPVCSLKVAFTNPFTNKAASNEVAIAVGVYRNAKIARRSGLKVDGDLSDIQSVAPLRVADISRALGGSKAWHGPQDNSMDIRLATDGNRLFVSVDVTDDEISVDHVSWRNDSIMFMWDAAPEPQPNTRRKVDIDWCRLVVPAEGERVEPVWPNQVWSGRGRTPPKGFVAVCKRRPGGYVLEWSAPLSELGLATPVQPGSTMRLQLTCLDRDTGGGKPFVSNMSTSGMKYNTRTTVGYIRCTFE